MNDRPGSSAKLVGLLLAAELAAILMLAGVGERKHRAHLLDQRRWGGLAADLQLTGVALWSEATYCRQPALADLFGPCGAHPGAPEALPAGSLVRPPRPIVAPPSARSVSTP